MMGQHDRDDKHSTAFKVAVPHLRNDLLCVKSRATLNPSHSLKAAGDHYTAYACTFCVILCQHIAVQCNNGGVVNTGC